MLIKIDDGIYINTDHICLLRPTVIIEGYQISMVNGKQLIVNDQVAQYIIAFMEPNEGLDKSASEAVPARSLPSRIATYLKERPQGAQLSDIINDFAQDAEISIGEAIITLQKEQVIVIRDSAYFHKATPEPARQDDFLNQADFDTQGW